MGARHGERGMGDRHGSCRGARPQRSADRPAGIARGAVDAGIGARPRPARAQHRLSRRLSRQGRPWAETGRQDPQVGGDRAAPGGGRRARPMLRDARRGGGHGRCRHSGRAALLPGRDRPQDRPPRRTQCPRGRADRRRRRCGRGRPARRRRAGLRPAAPHAGRFRGRRPAHRPRRSRGCARAGPPYRRDRRRALCGCPGLQRLLPARARIRRPPRGADALHGAARRPLRASRRSRARGRRSSPAAAPAPMRSTQTSAFSPNARRAATSSWM